MHDLPTYLTTLVTIIYIHGIKPLHVCNIRTVCSPFVDTEFFLSQECGSMGTTHMYIPVAIVTKLHGNVQCMHVCTLYMYVLWLISTL